MPMPIDPHRRILILRELGLTPVWVPRDRALGAGGVLTGAVAEPHVPERTTEPLAEDHATVVSRMEWPDLKQAVRACTACALHKGRTQTVFGVGDERADWLFIGEGPGAEEDARGEPFVGQAGRLLDNMLATIGIARGRDVYIANVVKCRPPGNRVPEPSEVAQCEPFLLRQIALIGPRLIIALGKTAASNLLHTDASISSMRGRLHTFQGIPLLVTYHPAYLLRNLPDKAKAWEDLCLARDTMASLKAKAAAAN
jgi:DNA polymerase